MGFHAGSLCWRLRTGLRAFKTGLNFWRTLINVLSVADFALEPKQPTRRQDEMLSFLAGIDPKFLVAQVSPYPPVFFPPFSALALHSAS